MFLLVAAPAPKAEAPKTEAPKKAAPAPAPAAAPKAKAPAAKKPEPIPEPEVEDVDDEVVADLYGKEHLNVVFMGHVGKVLLEKFQIYYFSVAYIYKFSK